MNRTQADLPKVEDATQDDLQLAIELLGPLAQYGGFVRAALGGIAAERQRATVAEVEEVRAVTHPDFAKRIFDDVRYDIDPGCTEGDVADVIEAMVRAGCRIVPPAAQPEGNGQPQDLCSPLCHGQPRTRCQYGAASQGWSAARGSRPAR